IAARQTTAFEQLLARVREVPGIGRVAYSNNGLFMGSDNGDELIVEGYTPKDGRRAGSRYDQVGSGYFSVLGIPLRAGRELTGDARSSAVGGVCVINEAFAKKFFDGRNPIGQHVTQVYANQRHTYEVVGVAANARQGNLRSAIEIRFYVPMTQAAADIGSM